MWCPGIVPVGHPLRNGIASLWPFWEVSGTRLMDVSGSGNNATLNQTTVWGRVIGPRGLRLHKTSTTQDIECPTTGMTTAAGTITLWFELESDYTDGYLIGHFVTDNRIYIHIDSGDLYSRLGTSAAVDSGFNVVADTLYLLAITWQGTAYGLYMNGVLVDSGTFSGLTNLAGTFRYSSVYDGQLDIKNSLYDAGSTYSRALSAGEVERLYRKPWELITMPDDLPMWVGATSVGAVAIPWYYYAQEQAVA